MFEPAAKAQQARDNFKSVRIKSVAVDVLCQRDVVIRVERWQKIETLKHEADFVPAQ